MKVNTEKLGLTAQERAALREAGVVPADVLHLRAEDLVGATHDAIGPARAAEIVGRASLLSAGVGSGFVKTLALHGIRDRADLASRELDDLFLEVVGNHHQGHNTLYDRLAQAVYLARTDTPSRERLALRWWKHARMQRAFDPLLMYWKHVHGKDTPFPTRTRDRLRIPSAQITAQVSISDRPVWPMDGGVVRAGQLVLGHHLWRGAQAAFHELETVEPGAEVELGSARYQVTTVCRGEPAEPGDGLVLTTPPHRRPHENGVIQVVVRCVAT